MTTVQSLLRCKFVGSRSVDSAKIHRIPETAFWRCCFQTIAEPTVLVRDNARTLRLCAHSGKWACRYPYPNSRLMASKYFCLVDNVLELRAPGNEAGAHELLNCKVTR